MKKILIVVAILMICILASVVLFIKNKKVVNKESINSSIDSVEGLINETSIQNVDKLDAIDAYYYMCTVQEDNYYGLKENATREEKEKIYSFHKNEKAMLYELCKKVTDLSLIPCSKDLEVLGFGNGKIKDFDYDYDTIERIDKEESSNGNSFILVKTTKGSIEKIYRLTYGWNDDSFNNIYVKLEEEKDVTSGELLKDNIVLFDNEHIKLNFEELCLDREKRLVYPQEEWDGTYYGDNIAISESFREKYSYFLDIFIHYSPLEYNKITLKDLNIEEQTAIFEVDSVLECKRRTYKVKYMLDDKMYLDDVEVVMKNEQIVDNSKSSRMERTFYKHSNWDNIKITDSFRNKFQKNDSTFLDIEKLDNNFSFDRNKGMYDAVRFELFNQKFQIREFKINDSWIYYLWYYILDANDNLDDVIYAKLPYDSSLTLEEVRDKFIADKELQKELGIEISG